MDTIAAPNSECRARLAIEDRLHERPEPQAVVGADEMDRAPHHDDPHDLPGLEQLRHDLRVEGSEARPEADVRVAGHLRLHADQVLDHGKRGSIGPHQEVLAGEGGAVQRAIAEQVGRHRLILLPETGRPMARSPAPRPPARSFRGGSSDARLLSRYARAYRPCLDRRSQ